MNYREYIASALWVEQRERWHAVERDATGKPAACAKCGGTERLTLHHRRYNRLGCEEHRDLVCLCWPCHEGFHQLHGNKLSKTAAWIRGDLPQEPPRARRRHIPLSSEQKAAREAARALRRARRKAIKAERRLRRKQAKQAARMSARRAAMSQVQVEKANQAAAQKMSKAILNNPNRLVALIGFLSASDSEP